MFLKKNYLEYNSKWPYSRNNFCFFKTEAKEIFTRVVICIWYQLLQDGGGRPALCRSCRKNYYGVPPSVDFLLPFSLPVTQVCQNAV